MPTAELVVEIVSADDGTWDKLGFYVGRHVNELLIIEPASREIHWLALRPDDPYQPIERSALVSLGGVELAARIDWPQ